MPARLIEDLVWIANKLDRDYNNISMTESHDIVCAIEQVIKIARDQKEG